MNQNNFMKNYTFIILFLLFIIIALIWTIAISPQTPPAGIPELDGLMLMGLFIIGLLAGYFGGLLGIGGGIIMLPILTFGLHFPTPIAVGTTLFAIIFTAISGGYAHLIRGNVHKQSTLFLSLFGIAGISVGSYLFTLLSSHSKLLNLILGLFFVFSGMMMIGEVLLSKQKTAQENHPVITINKKGLSALGFTVGFLTGILGLGGGYMLVPGMTYLFGYPIYLAIGTSLTSVIPITIVGGSIKLLQNYVLLTASLALAAGTIIGAQVGAATIKRFKPATLKLIFGLYFTYTAIRLILSYWG